MSPTPPRTVAIHHIKETNKAKNNCQILFDFNISSQTFKSFKRQTPNELVLL